MAAAVAAFFEPYRQLFEWLLDFDRNVLVERCKLLHCGFVIIIIIVLFIIKDEIFCCCDDDDYDNTTNDNDEEEEKEVKAVI